MGPDTPAREGRVAAGTDVDAYLRRIGVDPETVVETDLTTLERLQRAHVATVPFENLDIVGDSLDGWERSTVVLSTPALHEKLVGAERGGYCFELNGLFHRLLDELGFDVDRVAARVVTEERPSPPANHHANVVHLDRRYVVDVGMSTPVMRRPTPLDGESRADAVGVEWRVVESERQDAAYCTQFRTPRDGAWSKRYVFGDAPRELHYFEATNDYLQRAPESPFTGDPIASVATDEGHRKLVGDTLIETAGDETRERTVSDDEFDEILAREFGIRGPPSFDP